MATVTEEFHTQYKEIMQDSMGEDSIFSAAVDRLNDEYDSLGLTGAEKAKMITTTISQMATAISGASMSTALELVMRADKAEVEKSLLEEQVKTEKMKQCVMQSECDMNTEKKDLLKEQVITEQKKQCQIQAECDLIDGKKDLVGKQEETEAEKKNLVIRQTASFDDKNRQEAMKSMAGIAQMMGTTGDIDAEGTVYQAHKTTVNNTLSKKNIEI
jgi:hypothetical protein